MGEKRMGNITIKEGTTVLFQGQRATIVDARFPAVNLVLESKGEISNQTFATDISITELQEACDTNFKLGDKVASVLGGGFKGIVTAFEYNTNRVICLSDGAEKDGRSGRWAYAPLELVRGSQKLHIKRNVVYVINGGTEVRTVENPKSNTSLLLVYTNSGRIFGEIPKVITEEELAAAGIGLISRADGKELSWEK